MAGSEIVVTLGGLGTVASLAWFFFGPRPAQAARVKGTVQEVDVMVKGGYAPDIIRVRKGIPLRLKFNRQEAGDCTSRVVFPDFGASRTLAPFATTTLEFTPDKAGEFGFACGMNMLHGTLIVEGGEPAEGLGEAPRPREDHGHPHEHAVAVGIGPTLQVGKTAQVEFAVLGGGVTCPTCVVSIETALKDLPGVDDVQVNFGAERITARYDPNQVSPEQMQQRVETGGYAIHRRDEPGIQETEDREAAERRAEQRDLTRRVVVGAILTAPVVFAVMVNEFVGAAWLPSVLVNPWLQLVLITPVMLYTGWPIHRTGWLTLRHRTADMNSLITVGTVAAFGFSVLVTAFPGALPAELRHVYYEAVGVILTLILLGRLLEAIAKGGTSEAIRKAPERRWPRSGVLGWKS